MGKVRVWEHGSVDDRNLSSVLSFDSKYGPTVYFDKEKELGEVSI